MLNHRSGPACHQKKRMSTAWCRPLAMALSPLWPNITTSLRKAPMDFRFRGNDGEEAGMGVASREINSSDISPL